MTHTPDYPPSPEYLARQAKRQKALDALKAKMSWTNAQFLAERDAEYVAKQRSFLGPQIIDCERDIAEDNDTEGYVRKYHTDEG